MATRASLKRPFFEKMKKQFSFCSCNLLLSEDPIKDNHRKDQESGFAFTLGEGNDLVCRAAAFYAEQLRGQDIEELMKDFGGMFNRMSNEQQFRWLGQQKSPIKGAFLFIKH